MNDPVDEITLRLYEKDPGTGRDTFKKIALSLGLLHPNDSRDTIIDVLQALIMAAKVKKWLSSKEIENAVIQIRKEQQLSLQGTAGSNIRRILKNLCENILVEKQKAKYRIINFNLYTALDASITARTQRIKVRIKEYTNTL